MNKILTMFVVSLVANFAMADMWPAGLSFDPIKKQVLKDKKDENQSPPAAKPIGTARAVVFINKSIIEKYEGGYLSKTEEVCKTEVQIGIFDLRNGLTSIDYKDGNVSCESTLDGHPVAVNAYSVITYLRDASGIVPTADAKALMVTGYVRPQGDYGKLPPILYTYSGTRDLQQKSFFSMIPANHSIECTLRGRNSDRRDCTFGAMESFNIYVEVQE